MTQTLSAHPRFPDPVCASVLPLGKAPGSARKPVLLPALATSNSHPNRTEPRPNRTEPSAATSPLSLPPRRRHLAVTAARAVRRCQRVAASLPGRHHHLVAAASLRRDGGVGASFRDHTATLPVYRHRRRPCPFFDNHVDDVTVLHLELLRRHVWKNAASIEEEATRTT